MLVMFLPVWISSFCSGLKSLWSELFICALSVGWTFEIASDTSVWSPLRFVWLFRKIQDLRHRWTILPYDQKFTLFIYVKFTLSIVFYSLKCQLDLLVSACDLEKSFSRGVNWIGSNPFTLLYSLELLSVVPLVYIIVIPYLEISIE